MDDIFNCIDTTVNKSSIHQFAKFLQKYPDVTKWFLCSDYCIEDANKPNDVVSFVLYPYILDFNGWNEVVNSMQKTDLKHCRQVSSSFCDFSKQGYFFSFNFILKEKNILDKLGEKVCLDYLLKTYIEMTEKWQITTPNNAESYKKINKKLRKLQNATKQKSFNYKMFGRVIKICFLAGYLRYLLIKEKDSIEVFSWLSDRDAITNWQNGIYVEFYHIISHCLCENKLSHERELGIRDLYLMDVEKNQFYDGANRVADFICGGQADFNYEDGSVTGEKQSVLLEDVISDNEYLVIFDIREKGVAKIIHRKVCPPL